LPGSDFGIKIDAGMVLRMFLAAVREGSSQRSLWPFNFIGFAKAVVSFLEIQGV
jgi:hypothetical protein